ncbi:phospholipase effector Tle1 domain-containing protein [Neolewinella persica]|uniref:phospholipase effector Tle1 domain-containing protein n=1 Tax=Neolewinella persica TaxID=70998 RepID=UPI00146A065C|nr:DUF2235 domain-containing protein [Neolewinella persica]
MNETNDKVAQLGKNIIVLCDGTSNQVNVYRPTNVVRIAERLNNSTADGRRRWYSMILA